jgi:hypothetical protein
MRVSPFDWLFVSTAAPQANTCGARTMMSVRWIAYQ